MESYKPLLPYVYQANAQFSSFYDLKDTGRFSKKTRINRSFSHALAVRVYNDWSCSVFLSLVRKIFFLTVFI